MKLLHEERVTRLEKIKSLERGILLLEAARKKSASDKFMALALELSIQTLTKEKRRLLRWGKLNEKFDRMN